MMGSTRITSNMAKAGLAMPMARFMRAISWQTRNMATECELIRLTYPSGKVYRGEFLNDKPHGVGSLTHTNGNLVRGVWNQGKMETSL
jgi:hypothetical protein